MNWCLFLSNKAGSHMSLVKLNTNYEWVTKVNNPFYLNGLIYCKYIDAVQHISFIYHYLTFSLPETFASMWFHHPGYCKIQSRWKGIFMNYIIILFNFRFYYAIGQTFSAISFPCTTMNKEPNVKNKMQRRVQFHTIVSRHYWRICSFKWVFPLQKLACDGTDCYCN